MAIQTIHSFPFGHLAARDYNVNFGLTLTAQEVYYIPIWPRQARYDVSSHVLVMVWARHMTRAVWVREG